MPKVQAMQRYLLRFAYSGHSFTGFQKQLPRLPLHDCDAEYQRLNRRTVQGAIEEAFYRLGPKNEVYVYGSSRTDTGVHALSSSAIVDLEVCEDDERCQDLELSPPMKASLVGCGKDGRRYFDPKLITAVVNRIFSQAELPIRLSNTLAVSPNFGVRAWVQSRTYAYRFALHDESLECLRTPASKNKKRGRSMFQPASNGLPVHLANHYSEFWSPFDMSAFEECLHIFSESEHNYASFMNKQAFPNLQKYATLTGVDNPLDLCVRKLKAKLVPLHSPGSPDLEPLLRNVRFYEARFTSRSFLHNQIRRMSGAAAAVALGAISTEDIRRMLDEPIVGSGWNERARTAPPQGLYLASVDYPDECLVGATDDVGQLPVGLNRYQAVDRNATFPLTDHRAYPDVNWKRIKKQGGLLPLSPEKAQNRVRQHWINQAKPLSSDPGQSRNGKEVHFIYDFT